jgi:hypothetical protein
MQIQDESAEQRLSSDCLRIVKHFDVMVRTVNVDLSLERIYEPSQAGAILKIFLHFVLQS